MEVYGARYGIFFKAIILIPLYKNAKIELYSCLKIYSIVILKMWMMYKKWRLVNWRHGL